MSSPKVDLRLFTLTGLIKSIGVSIGGNDSVGKDNVIDGTDCDNIGIVLGGRYLPNFFVNLRIFVIIMSLIDKPFSHFDLFVTYRFHFV